MANESVGLPALLESQGMDVRDLPQQFVPALWHFATYGSLMYLNENCSYRACRLTDRLTILLHPYEDRAVGLQLHDDYPLLQ